MKAVSAEEMSIIDANAAWLGVERSKLMENAGSAVCRAVLNQQAGLADKKIVVLCGPGNNGGDGMVAARHLASYGAEVTVILLAPPEKIRTDEARSNYEAVRNMLLTVKLECADSEDKLRTLEPLFAEADVLVDAVLGTGVRGKMSEPMRTAIQMANAVRALRVAVDIPSGVDPDTGEAELAFDADMTVSLHAAKAGLLGMKGRVEVVEIGIPPEAEFIAGPGQLNSLLRKIRKIDPASRRLAFVHTGCPSYVETADLLTHLPCKLVTCVHEELISSPATRQAVAGSDAILLSEDLNASTVAPFAPKNRPLIISRPSETDTRLVYVLLSESKQERTREKLKGMMNDVKQLSLKLQSPVYVIGEVDSISDGTKTYLNWKGTAIDAGKFRLLRAVCAWMVCLSKEPVLSMAACSHVMRGMEEEVWESPQRVASKVRERMEL